jgi:hypothetical protein
MKVNSELPPTATSKTETIYWDRFRIYEIFPSPGGRWSIGRGRGHCGQIIECGEGDFLVLDGNGRTLREHAATFEAALKAFG